MVNQSQESPPVDLVLEAIKNLEVDKMGKVVQAIVAVEVIFLKMYFSSLRNGVFFRKLFWPNARKNCSSGQEKLLKLKAENFANFFRHLDQFIQTGYRNMQEKLEKVLTWLSKIKKLMCKTVTQIATKHDMMANTCWD